MALYQVILIFPNGEERTLEVEESTYILDAAAKAGMGLPFTCLQGWCTTCAGKVLEGDARLYIDNGDALRYFPQDAEAGFVLLCTAKPKANCRILTHQSEKLREHRHSLGLPAPKA